MSVDSTRVCNALLRSSELAVISSSPSVTVLSAKGSPSYFSRYSSISSMDSGVRPGTTFLIHPRGMFFRATFRRAHTNWSYHSAVAGMVSTAASN